MTQESLPIILPHVLSHHLEPFWRQRCQHNSTSLLAPYYFPPSHCSIPWVWFAFKLLLPFWHFVQATCQQCSPGPGPCCHSSNLLLISSISFFFVTWVRRLTVLALLTLQMMTVRTTSFFSFSLRLLSFSSLLLSLSMSSITLVRKNCCHRQSTLLHCLHCPHDLFSPHLSLCLCWPCAAFLGRICIFFNQKCKSTPLSSFCGKDLCCDWMQIRSTFHVAGVQIVFLSTKTQFGLHPCGSMFHIAGCKLCFWMLKHNLVHPCWGIHNCNGAT